MIKNRSIKKLNIKKIAVLTLVFTFLIPMTLGVSGATIPQSSATNTSIDSQKSNTDESLPSTSAVRSEYGWVYGMITDHLGNPLNLASIIVYRPALSVTDAVKSRYVTYSGTDGTYRIPVLPGVYVIDVNKKGYSTERETGVTVEKGIGTKVNFMLVKTSVSVSGQGLLQGTVYGVTRLPTSTTNDVASVTSKIPIKGAQVTVYSLTASITAATPVSIATCFTDGNGSYEFSLAPGTYSVIASKGVATQQKEAKIAEKRITELDFLLKISNTAEVIDDAITTGNFGGEITVQQQSDLSFGNDVTIYDGVSITPVRISEKEIAIQVSGDEASLGKTIAVNIDPNGFQLGDKIEVTYDGETIDLAHNLTDVLDPNDDGSHPEYLLLIGSDSIQALVSVPHFSEHTITISSVIEAIGGITAVVLYIAVFALLGVVYIIPFKLLRYRERK
ncbi:MAG: carboxypeptidase-like regulatory domain-containing protein [Methanobacteriota archaeon]